MSIRIRKDHNGHAWIVEIDDAGEPTSKGKPILSWVFSAYTAPKRTIQGPRHSHLLHRIT